MSPKQIGPMRFREAAIRVLAESSHPMKCKEIVKIAIRDELIQPEGKTPANTLNSVIRRDIRNSRKSVFIDAGHGLYRLRKTILSR